MWSLYSDKSPFLCLLQVDFADVIAEPGGIHSVDLIWIWSNWTYTKSKWFLYRLLSAILGIPLALIWGLTFAFLSFGNIWLIVPCIKCCKVEFECLIRPFIKCTKSCYRPACRSVGLGLKILADICRKKDSLDLALHSVWKSTKHLAGGKTKCHIFQCVFVAILQAKMFVVFFLS